MSTSDHRLYLASLVLLVTVFSSNASFCNNLTSVEDRETPCFLAPSTNNPVLLSTSSNSLVLPCHVARSKQSLVEWWYSDPQKLLNIKIYPVYPPVRPTVLRFATSLTPYSKNLNETDIIDASILLPYVNVDDSGTYRCVIRPLPSDPLEQMENLLFGDDTKTSSLVYNVKLTGARLCHSNPGTLPCFTAMRTSSPTIIDAYQTSFLQCVVKSFNRPASVFWVVGDAVENALVINNYLLYNNYNSDKLRRIFPRSITDYSIELTLGANTKERAYSCVIDGASDQETTIFTYIVRNLDVERMNTTTLNGTHEGEQNIRRVDNVIDHLRSSSDSPAASGEVSENLGETDLTEEEEQQETTTSI